jgi:hypothetical protein
MVVVAWGGGQQSAVGPAEPERVLHGLAGQKAVEEAAGQSGPSRVRANAFRREGDFVPGRLAKDLLGLRV